MAVETTFNAFRDDLAGTLDRVVNDREVVVVRRRGGKNVAVVAADEFASLLETAHLLRSPANARRLKSALRRAQRGEGKSMTVAELRQSLFSRR
jgi:antitoxin YefM